jgi:hypothetical protein
MELRWKNNVTKEIGVAFVTDSDAEVLRAVGYEHFVDGAYTDDDDDGEWVEVWRPVKEN